MGTQIGPIQMGEVCSIPSSASQKNQPVLRATFLRIAMLATEQLNLQTTLDHRVSHFPTPSDSMPISPHHALMMLTLS